MIICQVLIWHFDYHHVCLQRFTIALVTGFDCESHPLTKQYFLSKNSKHSKTFLPNSISHSHTLPIWLAVGLFLVQTNQSVLFSCRKSLNWLWFLYWNALLGSFSAPTKLVALSFFMLLNLPILVIIILSAIINESLSIVATTLKWTAMLNRHINKAPYLFGSLYLSFTKMT